VRRFITHPRVRLTVGLLAVVGVFFIRSPIVLAASLALVIVLAIATGIGIRFGRFLLIVIVPFAVALLVVWGIVVAAPPGTPMGSDAGAGFRYASVIALRLAIFGGIFQVVFLTMPLERLASTLRKCGIRGELFIIVLGAFALLPELALRSDQVLTARQARGLIPNLSFSSRLRQFPYVLRPLLAWALRSSIQRSEFWRQRRLPSKIEEFAALEKGSPRATDGGKAAVPDTSDADQTFGLRSGEMIALWGENFSGRTSMLRLFTGLSGDDVDESPVPSLGMRPTAYIGPEIYNVLSGLAQTVREEIRLYAGNDFEGTPLGDAARCLGLDRLYDRNPFTLSGGEQACLVVLCALALAPEHLALDGPLEQLDLKLRPAVLKLLSDARLTRTVITHNRSSELGDIRASDIVQLTRLTTGNAVHRFASINADEMAVGAHGSSPIKMRGMGFKYPGEIEILRDISLDLIPGNLYYLCGENGAGKSTLAKILVGVLKPAKGEMSLGTEPFQPWKTPGRIVAYHAQNPDLQIFSTTVEDEVYAGPRAARYSNVECSRLAEAMMKTFGLSRVREEHPLDLPFVVRKRVALAAVLAAATPWVVLDEPTLGQDESSSIAIAKITQTLLDAGTGVIVISHSAWFRNLVHGHPLLLQNGAVTSLPEKTYA
jgi:energy-coupling factor transport system ATP-binding protein